MTRAILGGASAVLALVVFGCGGNTTGSGTGTSGSGGFVAAGGAGGSGGISDGGALGTGAVGGTGGTVGSGGSNTTGGVTGSGGSNTTGGVTGSGGSNTTGGVTGSGGSGSGGSPGKVSIEFTVIGPESYCHQGCAAPPSISIQGSTGPALDFGSDCQTNCDTCSLSLCPPGVCYEDGAVTGATMDWDGSYDATSTCGAGKSCLEPAIAKPGKYTATFCATPGNMTGPDGGFRQCVVTGAAKCGSVEFEFPSNTVVKGTLGP